MTSHPHSRRHRRSPLGRITALTTCASLAVGGIALASFPAAAADSVDAVAIDFSSSTGAFQGGASGMLYGLSDDGVPTDAIIAGARPRNVTQKAPGGEQHPNGDPLHVEEAFFANGGEYLMVNIQDYYPDWPYNGGQRPADFSTYLDIVRTVVTDIRDNSAYPERYVFTPFNEPDGGNWYSDWGQLRETYLDDWKQAYELIREILPEARIAGMGDTGWRADRTREILTFALENDVVPDIWTWHELGIDNLADFRGHLAEYRQIERDLGIEELRVNINEYAMRRDMSVPGQIVQWLAMFEDEKVDAQTAYWTFAGNLNDNMAKGNAANGAWWLLKWYGDLTGDTVALTPPALNVADTVQGIATIDEERRQATVVIGGGSDDIELDLAGLDPAVFGETVDIQVRESAWTGQEGEAQAPRIVAAERVALSGDLAVTVPNDDRLSAYQVVITPALAEQPTVDPAWRTSIEAEDTVLRDVVAYNQPMSDPWVFAASGQRDVGSTNRVTSSLTWNVDVPAEGEYRFGVTAGVNGPDIGPGSHALFVDDEFAGLIEYEAGFGWTYRGRAEIVVPLTAGEHELSVRMSRDGATLLPGSDISLDTFDLELLTGPETHRYPAHLARSGSAPSDGGAVTVGGEDSATFYVSARESGYHDVALAYISDAAASVGLVLNGREIDGLAADGAGAWESTARVHLREGINEITVGAGGSIHLHDLTTTRVAPADGAIERIELEDAARVSLAGAARAEDVAAPTNVSGRQVGWLGNGADNTATITRGDLAAGAYDLQVRYANAEKNTGHAYNADIITRFLDVTEVGGEAQRGAFRHNYSWKGFWTHTVGVDLRSETADIVLSNETGAAPNIDWVAFAPVVLEVTNDEAPAIGDATLEVTAMPTKTAYRVGEPFDPAGLAVAMRRADELTPLSPEQYVVTGFDSAEPGSKTVTVTADIDGRTLTATLTVTVAAETAEPEPEPGVTPSISLSSSTVTAGEELTVRGAGLPGAAATEVWLESDPVLLERATTTETGDLVVRVRIPADTAAGAHTVVVRSGDVDVRAALEVRAAATGNLAVTGGAMPWLAGLLGAALLTIGGAIVARRRRTTLG